MSLMRALDGIPAVHHLVRWFKVREIIQAGLRKWPVVKTLPQSQVKYRFSSLETFFLADEFFKRDAYGPAVLPDTTTFVDLGSNAGLFAALLAHKTGRRDLCGLMVDANPAMVSETQWLLSQNSLNRIQAIHGLVGAETDAKEVDFFILPSSLGSSQFDIYEPGKPPKGAWKKVSVPVLNLEELWQKNFGDKRCQLLKVDIEGSEKSLFRREPQFLKRVDRVIMEWHTWIVSRQKVEQDLAAAGFRLKSVLHEEKESGIAWYARS
ncbi:MAG: FkbM family methyltransferase [Pedosphaera sp.]|nr:FkbM family methyltransferase [Pedosphaera sp.]